MSKDNFLDKLLDGADTEWIPLSEVLLSTSNIKWKGTSRSYRYIDLTSVDIQRHIITKTSLITEKTAPSRAQKLVEKDDVIFATTRPTQMRFCLIDDEYAGEVASTGYCILRAKQQTVLPKWILYWISSTAFKDYLEEQQSGSAYPAISDSKVKAFEIPVPCPENPEKSLAIQAEIVRILDTFAELTAKLTAELTAELTDRTKQYKYYRELLLTFEADEVEWKTLKDVANFQNAKPHEKLVSPDGDVVLLTSGFISNSGKMVRHVRSQDVLTPAFENDVALVMSDLPNGRALAKSFFIDQNSKYAANQRVCLLRTKDSNACIPRFLHYVMNRNPQLLAYDNGLDQTHLKKDWILSVRIPLPPREEQTRIVAILDKFDTLTHSISEDLPREIELRQKQYEYYRDLLLNFPKSSTGGSRSI